MDILAINLNKYKGLESVLKDDLENDNAKIDYLIINGEKELYLKLTDKLVIKNLYVGFSPLASSELVGLAALLSFLNNSSEYKIRYYEEPYFDFSVDPLVLSLISYFKSADLTKTIFHISSISDNTSGSFKFVPNFESVIYPCFKFNKIIYSLYTTSLGACQYKDMGRNILNSFNNNSISINLLSQLSAIQANFPEFQPLVSCLDIYLKLAKQRNINALIFYVSLFLNVSAFNKNRNEFTIAYVFLQRAIETALTHYYFSSGVLELNEYERLCFKGERKSIQGVGDLIKEYFSTNYNPQLEKKISKLNVIRNRSVLAHGFYIPSSSDFDELFDASKTLIDMLFSDDDIKKFYQISLNSLKPLTKENIKTRVGVFFNIN
ncbi:TPA: hypothetical protein NVL56_002659 [Enterobacter hormaechei subsp. xiangfangensis]|nr:hypothetical protein [Enterobacter hormaechei subsp. xiangfangensis]